MKLTLSDRLILLVNWYQVNQYIKKTYDKTFAKECIAWTSSCLLPPQKFAEMQRPGKVEHQDEIPGADSEVVTTLFRATRKKVVNSAVGLTDWCWNNNGFGIDYVNDGARKAFIATMGSFVEFLNTVLVADANGVEKYPEDIIDEEFFSKFVRNPEFLTPDVPHNKQQAAVTLFCVFASLIFLNILDSYGEESQKIEAGVEGATDAEIRGRWFFSGSTMATLVLTVFESLEVIVDQMIGAGMVPETVFNSILMKPFRVELPKVPEVAKAVKAIPAIVPDTRPIIPSAEIPKPTATRKPAVSVPIQGEIVIDEQSLREEQAERDAPSDWVIARVDQKDWRKSRMFPTSDDALEMEAQAIFLSMSPLFGGNLAETGKYGLQGYREKIEEADPSSSPNSKLKQLIKKLNLRVSRTFGSAWPSLVIPATHWAYSKEDYEVYLSTRKSAQSRKAPAVAQVPDESPEPVEVASVEAPRSPAVSGRDKPVLGDAVDERIILLVTEVAEALNKFLASLK